MKLLIFGGAGQMGREVGRAARPASLELLPLDKSAGDVTDPRTVSTVIAQRKPDLVINLAAYTAVDRAEREPEIAWAVNCGGASNIAEACAETATPLVHLSTDYVFSGSKGEPYREEDAVSPINVYGRSKEAGERAVRAALTRHVILRTAWVYGAFGTNFVKAMLRLGAERPALRVVADQYGCPTAAADIAAALLMIAQQIEQDRAEWGTFHLAGTASTSWYEFAEGIIQLAANFGAWRDAPRPQVEPITTDQYETAARRPMNSSLDCRKIANSFGISLPSWRASLAAVVCELAAEKNQ